MGATPMIGKTKGTIGQTLNDIGMPVVSLVESRTQL